MEGQNGFLCLFLLFLVFVFNKKLYSIRISVFFSSFIVANQVSFHATSALSEHTCHAQRVWQQSRTYALNTPGLFPELTRFLKLVSLLNTKRVVPTEHVPCVERLGHAQRASSDFTFALFCVNYSLSIINLSTFKILYIKT